MLVLLYAAASIEYFWTNMYIQRGTLNFNLLQLLQANKLPVMPTALQIFRLEKVDFTSQGFEVWNKNCPPNSHYNLKLNDWSVQNSSLGLKTLKHQITFDIMGEKRISIFFMWGNRMSFVLDLENQVWLFLLTKIFTVKNCKHWKYWVLCLIDITSDG